MWVVPLSLCIIAAASTPRSGGASGAPDPRYPSEEALRRYAQGRMLEESSDGDQALGEYYRVLMLDSHSTAAARRVSELSARLGDPPRSLEFANKALALDSLDARAWWLRGSALFNMGRSDEALAALETAVATDSEQVDFQKTLARVGEELDRYEIVARAYGKVVELDEEDGEAWFQLAAAEARMGHFSAARSALGESMAINSARPGVFFLQGWIEEGLGETRHAIELYQQHLRIHPGDEVTRRRMVNLMAEDHRYDEAFREAHALVKSHPEDESARAVEADLAFKLNRTGEGQRMLADLEHLAPDSPLNLERRIDVLATNKRVRDAVTLAGGWAARHPGDYHGPLIAARAWVIAGDPPAALAEARRAADLAPDSLAPQLLIGRIQQVSKHYAAAESVWAALHARLPDRADIGLDLAYCRERQGDLDGAEATARDVLQAEPENVSALNFLGYMLADRNVKLSEAERLIERAVEREPDNGAFVDSRGWVYFRLGRLDDARRDLERAVQLSNGDPVVCEHLGDVYKEMRLIDLARQQYRRSLAADHSNQRVRTKLDALR